MAAYSFTFTPFPAYTGSLDTLTNQLAKALIAIDNNVGHAGPNNDTALYQKVISNFFFANRDRVSAINVVRNNVFLGYVDADGFTTTDPATVKTVLGVLKPGDASATMTLTSPDTVICNTALTADRTITLPSATSARRITVTRTANATGAFNLLVKQGATTLFTGAVKTWAEFQSDGTTWFLVAQGTLP